MHYGSFAEIIISNLLDLSKEEFESKKLREVSTNTGICLANLSTIIKNPAFSEEKEIRIVLTPFGLDSKPYEIIELGIGKPRARVMSDHICTYYPLNFEDAGLHLTEVVLGPKNTSHKEDILSFLHEHGFHYLERKNISRSRATYR